MAEHRIEDIVALLTARIEELCAALLPAGKKRGSEWVEAAVRHGGLGDSLSVKLYGGRAGVWGHFATGDGGDALDLIAYVQTGGDKRAALAWAKSFLGLSDQPGGEADRRATEWARQAALARERKEARERAQRSAHAQAMWLSAAALEPGDCVDRYLAGRQIGLLHLGRRPNALRAGREVRHASGGAWPAMLAAFVGLDGRHVATHRTYLSGDGRKAAVDPVKSVLGGFRGAHIPLWKGESRRTLRQLPEGVPVYISEGIEDGLSAAVLVPGARVIAAGTLGNMAVVELPAQVRSVVLIGQNDAAGSPAAKAFARAIEAHAGQGREVRVARPPAAIKDFNDWLRDIRRAAARENGECENGQ